MDNRTWEKWFKYSRHKYFTKDNNMNDIVNLHTSERVLYVTCYVCMYVTKFSLDINCIKFSMNVDRYALDYCATPLCP